MTCLQFLSSVVKQATQSQARAAHNVVSLEMDTKIGSSQSVTIPFAAEASFSNISWPKGAEQATNLLNETLWLRSPKPLRQEISQIGCNVLQSTKYVVNLPIRTLRCRGCFLGAMQRARSSGSADDDPYAASKDSKDHNW